MNDQMALEEGCNNEPLKELYPTQTHTSNPTKLLEMLLNVLRMIRDVNGVSLAAVIRKRLIPLPDNEDMAFGLRHSKYISHDDEMIERASILDQKEYDQNATDKNLERTGPFDPRYKAVRSLVWTIIKGCIGTNNKLNLQLKQYNRATDGRSAYFAIDSFVLGNDHSSSLISAAEQGLRDTTYTTNVKNWKIEHYVSKHMEFQSTLNDQQERGTYSGMYEEQKVDKFLDGLKHSNFIGLRSMILCNPKI